MLLTKLINMKTPHTIQHRVLYLSRKYSKNSHYYSCINP